MMKVTSRELTLLIALLVVGFIFLLYTFLFNPMLGNISVAREALSIAKEKQVQVEENHKNLPNIIKQQKSLAKETDEKVAQFLPNINEDVLLSFFAATVAKGGPGLDGVSFNKIEAISLDTIVAQPYAGISYPYGDWALKAKGLEVSAAAATSSPATEGQPALTVLAQGVSIDFSNSGYEQIINQIKAVEATKRAIVVDTLSISKGESGSLEGSIHYNFYGVDKLTDKDIGISKTALTDPQGKVNPFI